MPRKAKKKWMQNAVKRPGAATRKANSEGLSVSEWAQRHKGDSGLRGQEARFAVTARKVAKKRQNKRGTRSR